LFIYYISVLAGSETRDISKINKKDVQKGTWKRGTWLFLAKPHPCLFILLIAGLHDLFNRARFSVEAFSSQSKLIKKLSNGKKIG